MMWIYTAQSLCCVNNFYKHLTRPCHFSFGKFGNIGRSIIKSSWTSLTDMVSRYPQGQGQNWLLLQLWRLPWCWINDWSIALNNLWLLDVSEISDIMFDIGNFDSKKYISFFPQSSTWIKAVKCSLLKCLIINSEV